MIEQAIAELNTMYHWLPGGVIAPFICGTIGFMFGFTDYVRSFKYWNRYYIEHGEVICFMENHVKKMHDVVKKHRLNELFKPVGYVSGVTWTFLQTVLGVVIGTVWPLAVAIGIFTIPNFLIRYVAREKRNKAIFEQELKGDT